MANANISIALDGQTQVIATLQGLSTRGKNLKPWTTKSGNILINTFKENFVSAGSKLDKPWATRRKSYAWPILNKTGRMKSSFVNTADNKKAVISNSDGKFPYHQLGTRRNLPPRKMIGITSSDAATIANLLADYIMKGNI